MTTLIWQPNQIISTEGEMSFTVKMNDGSNMDNAEQDGSGFAFIELMRGYNSIDIDRFDWGLGLGHKDYNYDEYWNLASQNFQNNQGNLVGGVAALGSGIGVVSGHYISRVPYHGWVNNEVLGSDGSVSIQEVYWEAENRSAIVKLRINNTTFPRWANDSIWADAGVHYGDSWFDSLGIQWGTAPFLQEDPSAVGDLTVSAQDVSGYNILVSFELKLYDSDTGTTHYIECADSNIISNAVGSEGVTLAFAPVYFSDSLYDFDINILNINKPTFVYEADFGSILLEIKSEDYNGGIEIYLVDNESVDEINNIIGEDLSQWYGQLGEDVVAQYGTMDYNGVKIISDEIVVGEIKTYDITYNANNVDGGQTDNMSIFIRYNAIDIESYQDEQSNAQFQWELRDFADNFEYVDTISIPILDLGDEPIDSYEPSDNIIIQPVDIMHHVLGEELGFDKNNVDRESKEISWSQHNNWQFSFSVNEEIDSKILIQEMSKSCKSVPSLFNDKLKFITIKDTYDGTENISIINSDDVIKYSFSRTPIEDVKTQVEVKYDKDYGLNTYLSSTGEINVDSNNYFISGKYIDYKNFNIEPDNYYGIKYNELINDIDHIDTFMVVENNYIRDNHDIPHNTAFELANYLLEWHKNQHNIISVTLPLKYYALEIGDLIEFNEMILGKKLYSENYVVKNPEDMPIRCGQFILPLFMITEINKGMNNITIKATQLHHMLNNDLNWKGEKYSLLRYNLGDVNNDGYLDVLDVVLVVQHLVGISELTGDALLAADYNGDGVVDVLDLVAIIDDTVQ